MTAKQSSELIKNPNTQKAIAVLEKFATIEAQYKELEVEQKKATQFIQDAMMSQGVDRLDIDLPSLQGYITLAERTTFKAEDIMEVEAKYLKSTLDTAKVKAAVTLTGNLPDGITESKTQYITKKLKLV